MANANITPEQRDGILGLTAALFNAAPGGLYLNDMALAVQGGMTQLQLAEVLTNHPVFVDGVMGGRVTPADKVNLLMKNFGLMADSNPASAGSQAKDYFDAKFAAGESMAQIVVDAITYLNGKVAPGFEATKNLFLNKVAVAAPFSLQSNSMDLSVLQNALSQVVGDHAYTPAEAQLVANNASTNTLVFTDGIDLLQGTSGNDTFIGVSANIQPGDQVSGGSGIDILKIVGDYAGSALPASITGVELLQISKVTNAAQNFSSVTKAATGIAKIQIDDAALLSAQTITTTDGQALSLATASGAATAGGVTWAASAADTTLNLTLNNYQGAATAIKDLTITAAKATTVDITSDGSANNLYDLKLGAVTDKLVVKGSGDFHVANNVVSTGGATVLKTIDASAATGDISLTLAAVTNAAFAFTGGAGDDTLVLPVGGIAALTAGSQLDGGAGNDTLSLAEIAPLTAAQIAKVNATKGFETLQFTGVGSGVDVSTITNASITNFEVGAAAPGGGLRETFTNANSKSNFIIDNSNGNTSTVSISNKIGEDSTSVTIDSGSATAVKTLTGLDLPGISKVALTSSGDAANVISSLGNADNAVITIKGDAGLTLTTRATATGSKVDGSAANGDLTLNGNNKAFASGSSLGDILIGGKGTDTIKASVNNATLTGNAGNDTFDVSAALGGTTSITTITDFTKGDIIKFGATAQAFTATKVDLTAATSESAALNLLAAGNNTDLKWGVYNGNTYVVDDVDPAATFAATDIAVKLTGALDLSTSTFAVDAITFA